MYGVCRIKVGENINNTIYTVFLVEDDEPTRIRLVKAVENHPQLQVLGHTGNVQDTLTFFTQHHYPDIFLTDLGLPDGTGIDLIKSVQKAAAEIEIMVITVFADEENVIAAIEAGASGYLLKDASVENVGHSIMQLKAGYSPLSPAIARHVLRRFMTPDNVSKEVSNQQVDIPQLTAREKQVLKCIAKGFSYKETAALLENSVHTVTSHIKKIYKKLSVKSRSEAVFEAIQLGIIDM